jgi:hypothetical protein
MTTIKVRTDRVVMQNVPARSAGRLFAIRSTSAMALLRATTDLFARNLLTTATRSGAKELATHFHVSPKIRPSLPGVAA